VLASKWTQIGLRTGLPIIHFEPPRWGRNVASDAVSLCDISVGQAKIFISGGSIGSKMSVIARRRLCAVGNIAPPYPPVT
jgi:hypothetical protein